MKASVTLVLRGAISVDVDVPDGASEVAIVNAAKEKAWPKVDSKASAATLEYDDEAGHDVYVDDEKISVGVVHDCARNRATLAAVIYTIGGTCDEGTPTHPINYLQRLRALVREEAALIKMADDFGHIEVDLPRETAWGMKAVTRIPLGALIVASVKDCNAFDALDLYRARKRGAPLWPRGAR